jgi:pilus assembly protein CpaB
MNSKRIVFLLLAVIVAGTTAFLARAWLQAERAAIAAQMGGGPARPAAKPAVQVLVARSALRAGTLIKPEHLRWQAWPQGSLPPTYIVEGTRPINDFVGAVVRVPFHIGQPIVEADIVMPGSRGFLAAVLKAGLRAVSIPLTATTGVSGFIYAGDRVDVLLTHTLQAQGSSVQHNATETILRNARVIAIDQRVDFAPGDKPEVGKTATLELTAKQAEIVTLGVKMGELSLVLRSMQETEEDDRDGNDDATAELGLTYTHDSQVSRLIREPGEGRPPEAPKPTVFVLRGSKGSKQDIDGNSSDQSPGSSSAEAIKPNNPSNSPPSTPK